MDIEQLHKLFLDSKGVGTDTRKDLKDKLFFALKGDNFNGNQYAQIALDNGAAFAVIDEETQKNDNRQILVQNVLKTLQDLAHFHRKYLGIPILGITGTNGKTTNKELISRVLSKKYKLYATKGNLNNHIGVPLSILEITKDFEFAVIEMGANKIGDIKELCEIADPDYGYITNIGIAHLEGFITPENIKIGKGELFRYIKDKNGVFFVNNSEKAVVDISYGYEQNIVIDDSTGNIFTPIQYIPNIVFEFTHGKKYYVADSQLYGHHNYENLKVSVAIGLYFGVECEKIESAIKEYKPDNSRSQVLNRNGLNIFLDAYNANPTSMKASIISFASFSESKKVLILGDMLELGEETEYLHREIINLVAKYNWTFVIFIGSNFMKVKSSKSDNTFYFKNKDEADLNFVWTFSQGTNILLKGSRGVALEKLKFIQEMI